jgi:hypothetical protein
VYPGAALPNMVQRAGRQAARILVLCKLSSGFTGHYQNREKQHAFCGAPRNKSGIENHDAVFEQALIPTAAYATAASTAPPDARGD